VASYSGTKVEWTSVPEKTNIDIIVIAAEIAAMVLLLVVFKMARDHPTEVCEVQTLDHERIRYHFRFIGWVTDRQ